MKFNEEQMRELTPYEKHFRTAIKADYTSHPGLEGLKIIHRIYTEVSKDQERLNDNCQSCILRLVKNCGRIYFDTQEQPQKKVEEAPIEAATEEKVVIKTKKMKKAE